MTRFARPAWHEAYDAQMALWRWYRTDEAGRWLAAIYREGAAGVPPSFRKQMALMYDGEMGRLVECDPIYVSAEMTEVVDHARHDFEPEPLRDFDLPTPRAFVWYDRPVSIHDRSGNPLWVRAFSWAQEYQSTAEGGGIEAILERLNSDEAVAEHGDRIKPSEAAVLVAEGLLEAYGVSVTIYADRERYLEAAARKSPNERRYEESLASMRRQTEGVPVVPMHLAPWHFGMEIDGNETDLYGEPTGVGEWWKLLQTTLRLMLQRKKASGYGRPDRPTRRNAQRLGFPPETEVVIVRLRREENPRREDAEPTGRTLSYRHYRTGHWRNQYYPSLDVYRQIRIMPTIVGDESLPLLVRPRRVFQWTR